jgi:hypothetical protein
MGSILASTIASRASVLLNDEDNDRWSNDEHLDAINDGQKEVCLFKPDAYIVNVPFQLSAGTKQSIPDGTNSFLDPDSSTIPAGIQLMDIVRNMGSDGDTPGNVITLIDMEQLDTAYPGWHSATAAAAVVHYMFREKDPKRFYVYPQQPTSNRGWIEVVMGAIPPDVADIGNAITLDDIYFNPLLNFVMYKAFLRDSDDGADFLMAQKYYDMFLQALVGKEQREKAEDPNPKPKGVK